MSRDAGAEGDFALYRFALFQQSPQRFARRPRRLQARDDRRGLLRARGFGLADALEEIAAGERPFGDAEDLRRARVGEDDSGVGRSNDKASGAAIAKAKIIGTRGGKISHAENAR